MKQERREDLPQSEDRRCNRRDQTLTAGPCGPSPPGHPLVPGSPWKAKDNGLRARTNQMLQQRVTCTRIIPRDDQQMVPHTHCSS